MCLEKFGRELYSEFLTRPFPEYQIHDLTAQFGGYQLSAGQHRGCAHAELLRLSGCLAEYGDRFPEDRFGLEVTR